MTRNASTFSVALVALALLVGVVAHYHGKIGDLRRENKDLRSKLATTTGNPGWNADERMGEYTRINGDTGTVTLDVGGLAEDLVAIEGERETLKEELDEVLKPLREDILSSMLRTTIRKGEVLVTGGYRTADGRHQYLMVEPSLEALANGDTAIRLTTRHFSISPEAMHSVGLDSLSTTAGNTLQHGEAWESAEMEEVVSLLLTQAGVDQLVAPQVVVSPGEKAELLAGDYRVRTVADLTADGSAFDMQLRVEQPRVPGQGLE